MIRGSTTTFTIHIPFEVAAVANLRITFAQDDEVLFKKELADCVIEGNAVRYTLTQEESLKFVADKFGQIQTKVLDENGGVILHIAKRFEVKKDLDGEVIE